jgi:hypothetical protein
MLNAFKNQVSAQMGKYIIRSGATGAAVRRRFADLAALNTKPLTWFDCLVVISFRSGTTGGAYSIPSCSHAQQLDRVVSFGEFDYTSTQSPEVGFRSGASARAQRGKVRFLALQSYAQSEIGLISPIRLRGNSARVAFVREGWPTHGWLCPSYCASVVRIRIQREESCTFTPGLRVLTRFKRGRMRLLCSASLSIRPARMACHRGQVCFGPTPLSSPGPLPNALVEPPLSLPVLPLIVFLWFLSLFRMSYQTVRARR